MTSHRSVQLCKISISSGTGRCVYAYTFYSLTKYVANFVIRNILRDLEIQLSLFAYRPSIDQRFRSKLAAVERVSSCIRYGE